MLVVRFHVFNTRVTRTPIVYTVVEAPVHLVHFLKMPAAHLIVSSANADLFHPFSISGRGKLNGLTRPLSGILQPHRTRCTILP